MEPLQEDDNLVDYTHELDLTNHHENIASGIKSIKQLYNLSSSGAKECLHRENHEIPSNSPSLPRKGSKNKVLALNSPQRLQGHRVYLHHAQMQSLFRHRLD